MEKKGESNLTADDKRELKKLLKQKDILERDALHNRLLKKDKEPTKQIDSKSFFTNTFIEDTELVAQVNLNMPFDEKMKLVADLRIKSRYTYLGKREEQQLDLFEEYLASEKKLFGDTPLTPEEITINNINSKLFDLAKKIRKKPEKAGTFQLPDAYDDEAEAKEKGFK